MSGLLDRRHASAILGVSVRTFRRLEARGSIARAKRAHGADWFASSDVYALRAEREAQRPTTDGEIAARVYRCIARGMRINDIVTQARQPPELVRELFEQYHDADGAMVLSAPHLAAIVSVVGEVRTGEELATRIVQLARRQPQATA